MQTLGQGTAVAITVPDRKGLVKGELPGTRRQRLSSGDPSKPVTILEGGGPRNTHPNLTLLLHPISCWYFSLTESHHNPNGKGAY